MIRKDSKQTGFSGHIVRILDLQIIFHEKVTGYRMKAPDYFRVTV